MSADGVPYVGRTKVEHLHLNTGHGHLGWTLAAGSACLLADLITAQPAQIEAEPYRASR
jgi:D-amino-acid dehydrogenase